MKNRFLSLLLIVVFAFSGNSMVNAQSKSLMKDVKKTTKEWKKEGWTLLASSSTMEYALTKYRTYIEEDEENHIEITGVALSNNPKIGRESAIMNGITNYASRAKAQVIGKMKSLMSSDVNSMSEDEIDKFGAAYEVGVNTKLSGMVKVHFVKVRDNGGKKEFQAYMSIDEKSARKAREDAAREAKRKATLENLSEQVSDFIGQPVPMD